MKKYFPVLAVLLIAFAAITPALAQSDALTLRMNRDFGYGGFDNDIEGLFSVIAEGPADLQRVEFYIDGQLMAAVDTAPFRYQFSTKSYEAGTHTLSALGYTASGAELHSNEITRIFLSADEARGKTIQLIIPIFGIVALIAFASIMIPVLFGRAKPQRGKYGISGGAVCPKCNLPFPIHFFSFHSGRNNYERCPHCGKWSWVRKASAEDLAAAEARWAAADAPEVTKPPSSDRLKRQIDDSRYEK